MAYLQLEFRHPQLHCWLPAGHPLLPPAFQNICSSTGFQQDVCTKSSKSNSTHCSAVPSVQSRTVVVNTSSVCCQTSCSGNDSPESSVRLLSNKGRCCCTLLPVPEAATLIDLEALSPSVTLVFGRKSLLSSTSSHSTRTQSPQGKKEEDDKRTTSAVAPPDVPTAEEQATRGSPTSVTADSSETTRRLCVAPLSKECKESIPQACVVGLPWCYGDVQQEENRRERLLHSSEGDSIMTGISLPSTLTLSDSASVPACASENNSEKACNEDFSDFGAAPVSASCSILPDSEDLHGAFLHHRRPSSQSVDSHTSRISTGNRSSDSNNGHSNNTRRTVDSSSRRVISFERVGYTKTRANGSKTERRSGASSHDTNEEQQAEVCNSRDPLAFRSGHQDSTSSSREREDLDEGSDTRRRRRRRRGRRRRIRRCEKDEVVDSKEDTGERHISEDTREGETKIYFPSTDTLLSRRHFFITRQQKKSTRVDSDGRQYQEQQSREHYYPHHEHKQDSQQKSENMYFSTSDQKINDSSTVFVVAAKANNSVSEIAGSGQWGGVRGLLLLNTTSTASVKKDLRIRRDILPPAVRAAVSAAIAADQPLPIESALVPYSDFNHHNNSSIINNNSPRAATSRSEGASSTASSALYRGRMSSSTTTSITTTTSSSISTENNDYQNKRNNNNNDNSKNSANTWCCGSSHSRNSNAMSLSSNCGKSTAVLLSSNCIISSPSTSIVSKEGDCCGVKYRATTTGDNETGRRVYRNTNNGTSINEGNADTDSNGVAAAAPHMQCDILVSLQLTKKKTPLTVVATAAAPAGVGGGGAATAGGVPSALRENERETCIDSHTIDKRGIEAEQQRTSQYSNEEATPAGAGILSANNSRQDGDTTTLRDDVYPFKEENNRGQLHTAYTRQQHSAYTHFVYEPHELQDGDQLYIPIDDALHMHHHRHQQHQQLQKSCHCFLHGDSRCDIAVSSGGISSSHATDASAGAATAASVFTAGSPSAASATTAASVGSASAGLSHTEQHSCTNGDEFCSVASHLPDDADSSITSGKCSVGDDNRSTFVSSSDNDGKNSSSLSAGSRNNEDEKSSSRNSAKSTEAAQTPALDGHQRRWAMPEGSVREWSCSDGSSSATRESSAAFFSSSIKDSSSVKASKTAVDITNQSISYCHVCGENTPLFCFRYVFHKGPSRCVASASSPSLGSDRKSTAVASSSNSLVETSGGLLRTSVVHETPKNMEPALRTSTVAPLTAANAAPTTRTGSREAASTAQTPTAEKVGDVVHRALGPPPTSETEAQAMIVSSTATAGTTATTGEAEGSPSPTQAPEAATEHVVIPLSSRRREANATGQIDVVAGGPTNANFLAGALEKERNVRKDFAASKSLAGNMALSLGSVLLAEDRKRKGEHQGVTGEEACSPLDGSQESICSVATVALDNSSETNDVEKNHTCTISPSLRSDHAASVAQQVSPTACVATANATLTSSWIVTSEASSASAATSSANSATREDPTNIPAGATVHSSASQERGKRFSAPQNPSTAATLSAPIVTATAIGASPAASASSPCDSPTAGCSPMSHKSSTLNQPPNPFTQQFRSTSICFHSPKQCRQPSRSIEKKPISSESAARCPSSSTRAAVAEARCTSARIAASADRVSHASAAAPAPNEENPCYGEVSVSPPCDTGGAPRTSHQPTTTTAATATESFTFLSSSSCSFSSSSSSSFSNTSVVISPVCNSADTKGSACRSAVDNISRESPYVQSRYFMQDPSMRLQETQQQQDSPKMIHQPTSLNITNVRQSPDSICKPTISKTTVQQSAESTRPQTSLSPVKDKRYSSRTSNARLNSNSPAGLSDGICSSSGKIRASSCSSYFRSIATIHGIISQRGPLDSFRGSSTTKESDHYEYSSNSISSAEDGFEKGSSCVADSSNTEYIRNRDRSLTNNTENTAPSSGREDTNAYTVSKGSSNQTDSSSSVLLYSWTRCSPPKDSTVSAGVRRGTTTTCDQVSSNSMITSTSGSGTEISRPPLASRRLERTRDSDAVPPGSHHLQPLHAESMTENAAPTKTKQRYDITQVTPTADAAAHQHAPEMRVQLPMHRRTLPLPERSQQRDSDPSLVEAVLESSQPQHSPGPVLRDTAANSLKNSQADNGSSSSTSHFSAGVTTRISRSISPSESGTSTTFKKPVCTPVESRNRTSEDICAEQRPRESCFAATSTKTSNNIGTGLWWRDYHRKRGPIASDSLCMRSPVTSSSSRNSSRVSSNCGSSIRHDNNGSRITTTPFSIIRSPGNHRSLPPRTPQKRHTATAVAASAGPIASAPSAAVSTPVTSSTAGVTTVSAVSAVNPSTNLTPPPAATDASASVRICGTSSLGPDAVAPTAAAHPHAQHADKEEEDSAAIEDIVDAFDEEDTPMRSSTQSTAILASLSRRHTLSFIEESTETNSYAHDAVQQEQHSDDQLQQQQHQEQQQQLQHQYRQHHQQHQQEQQSDQRMPYHFHYEPSLVTSEESAPGQLPHEPVQQQMRARDTAARGRRVSETHGFPRGRSELQLLRNSHAQMDSSRDSPKDVLQQQQQQDRLRGHEQLQQRGHREHQQQIQMTGSSVAANIVRRGMETSTVRQQEQAAADDEDECLAVEDILNAINQMSDNEVTRTSQHEDIQHPLTFSDGIHRQEPVIQQVEPHLRQQALATEPAQQSIETEEDGGTNAKDFKVLVVTPPEKESEKEEHVCTAGECCAICKEELMLQQEIASLPACSHFFCFPCIAKWACCVKKQQRPPCPLCKQSFSSIRRFIRQTPFPGLHHAQTQQPSSEAGWANSSAVGMRTPKPTLEPSGNPRCKRISCGSTNDHTGNDNSRGRHCNINKRNSHSANGGEGTRQQDVKYLFVEALQACVEALLRHQRRREGSTANAGAAEGERGEEPLVVDDPEIDSTSGFLLIASQTSTSSEGTAAGAGGCQICGEDTDWTSMLLCDGCDEGFHLYCLNPPLQCVPAGRWFCPRCCDNPPSVAAPARPRRAAAADDASRSPTTRHTQHRRSHTRQSDETSQQRISTEERQQRRRMQRQRPTQRSQPQQRQRRSRDVRRGRSQDARPERRRVRSKNTRADQRRQPSVSSDADSLYSGTTSSSSRSGNAWMTIGRHGWLEQFFYRRADAASSGRQASMSRPAAASAAAAITASAATPASSLAAATTSTATAATSTSTAPVRRGPQLGTAVDGAAAAAVPVSAARSASNGVATSLVAVPVSPTTSDCDDGACSLQRAGARNSEEVTGPVYTGQRRWKRRRVRSLSEEDTPIVHEAEAEWRNTLEQQREQQRSCGEHVATDQRRSGDGVGEARSERFENPPDGSHVRRPALSLCVNSEEASRSSSSRRRGGMDRAPRIQHMPTHRSRVSHDRRTSFVAEESRGEKSDDYDRDGFVVSDGDPLVPASDSEDGHSSSNESSSVVKEDNQIAERSIRGKSCTSSDDDTTYREFRRGNRRVNKRERRFQRGAGSTRDSISQRNGSSARGRGCSTGSPTSVEHTRITLQAPGEQHQPSRRSEGYEVNFTGSNREGTRCETTRFCANNSHITPNTLSRASLRAGLPRHITVRSVAARASAQLQSTRLLEQQPLLAMLQSRQAQSQQQNVLLHQVRSLSSSH